MPLNLTKPGEGTVAWAVTVNQNFTDIENAVNPPGALGPEFGDNVFRVVGSVDSTKKLAFEADGLSSGVTRTKTPSDRNGTLFDGGGKNAYASGLGAITHLEGPSDQPFLLAAGTVTGNNPGKNATIRASNASATSGNASLNAERRRFRAETAPSAVFFRMPTVGMWNWSRGRPWHAWCGPVSIGNHAAG